MSFSFCDSSLLLWETLLGFGSGLIVVNFYLHSLLKKEAHNRGKIIGVADSIQTTGDLLGSSIYIFINLLIGFLLHNLIRQDHALLLNETFFSISMFLISLVLFQIGFNTDKKNYYLTREVHHELPKSKYL